MAYAALFCQSNFSFLTGASHPEELIEQAAYLNYSAIALTDECSLAGIVKAHVTAKAFNIKLLIGSFFILSNQCQIIVLAPSQKGYAQLSGFISLVRRRTHKGSYQAHFDDLRFRLQHCLIIWLIDPALNNVLVHAQHFEQAFKGRLWLGHSAHYHGYQPTALTPWLQAANLYGLAQVATPQVLMHQKNRKPLLDTLWAIRQNIALNNIGTKLPPNAEKVLKTSDQLRPHFVDSLLAETHNIANLCQFSLDELRYQYPQEVVPKGKLPNQYLTEQVTLGEQKRWPKGTPPKITALIKKELDIIQSLNYEYYFLTVYDIVQFARSKNILCQGRGSAANSVVCYCLFITEISPDHINVLFERFISKERDEPPDIDVDFEHRRREEVIQYIYQKYGRERAALAASVVTYRARSAIRDVGKALGLDAPLIDHLASSLAWWDRSAELQTRIKQAGFSHQTALMPLFYNLVHQILGFPRHLSQHVGGFVITQGKISDLVPTENASMPERTVIQWDKDDIEAMGLLKVDVLALGMLTALRKALGYINECYKKPENKTQIKTGAKRGAQTKDFTLQDIPRDDAATYSMLSTGDSLGVFQVESRAQMAMLPRLKPKEFYDLVIQIAIVRPGPIQGDMVHPYLRRRNNQESVHYENPAIKEVLQSTLGVPIFQEQAIRLAMVAAGFSGGQADQLRRAMASFGKNGKLLQFEQSFTQGMLNNGYSPDYAHRLFEQIKGFGGYGFPESHSASFALLCYASAWIKCHYPAAFYCALLNSQPMGFYSPSQLVQDAIRHGIAVLPVDINRSDYDNTLEQHNNAWALRLGLCRIKGLKQDTANHIIQVREKVLFKNAAHLQQSTNISASELTTLAAADALNSISGQRHQALWHSAEVATHINPHKTLPIIFDNCAITPNDQAQNIKPDSTQDLWLAPPSEGSQVVSDYKTLGLSLRQHPMALLRNQAPFKRCKTYNQLSTINHGGFARVAGIVTGRQRPGTAKGTVFLTLEDETGNTNVVVWKNTQKHFHAALLSAKLLIVTGHLERQGDVMHVIAGRLEDYSQHLQQLLVKSRDFH